MMRTKTILGVAAAAALLALAGCGSDDATPAGGGAPGGTLTISAANPSTENTTIDLARASNSGNDARAADSFSAAPYCEVFFETVPGANNHVYALQVYFRQSDQAVLHISVVGSPSQILPASYVVFDNNGGNPITGATVDLAAKTISFNNKVLTGNAGEAGTLSGTASFPANSAKVAGCGA